MKAVQVMMDESLLEELDRVDEVRKEGRSAVIRRAVTAWLKGARERDIEAQYKRAYASGEGLGPDWAGWEDQGVWPDE
jgi:metal-responsive CopG/Arc/MetJ family transcriptional regulator